MAKDPAFLFYSQDWIVGCQALTMEERGQYITLIANMHQQGRMDEETIRLLVGSLSVRLKKKFKVDEDGFYYNERLEEESLKRSKFTESRRNNGLLGGRPASSQKTDRLSVAKPNGKPKPNLMGNENENENTVLSKPLVLSSNTVKRETAKKIEPVTPLQKFIAENLPNVSKITNQLTEKESERLIAKYPKELISDVLKAMENRKNLAKDYTSVNLTIQSWIKFRLKKSQKNDSDPQPPKADYSKQNDYYATQQSVGQAAATGD